MRKTSLLLGVLAIAAASAAVAGGHRGGPDAAGMFERLDGDGDGSVTMAEIEDARAQAFSEIDGNGDGTVSRAEFIAAAQARAAERAGQMFDQMDADGDGALSRDAIEAERGRGPGPRMFARLDADGDGAVSRAEFDEARARFGERRGGGRHGQGWRH